MSTDLLERPDTTAAPAPAPGLCWTTIAGLSLIHLAGIAGLVWIVLNPSLPTLVLTAVLYVACGLGITAGYHRLFAHRTYSPVAPVRWALLAFGAATFQNSALSWSADHRAHHADTDGAGDPHAVTRGAMVRSPRLALPPSRGLSRRDPPHRPQRGDEHPAAASLLCGDRGRCRPRAPHGHRRPMGGPVGGLLVGGFLRTAVMLQATFCVNSLAHLIGKRRYDARSSARDSVVTALITFGEGYHSFHHRFPFDYRNGPRWWQYDPGKWLIWTLGRLHLADRHADGVSGEQNESCGVGERLSRSST